jgi:hypothetical protein
VTAEAGAGQRRVNVALASSGATATAPSTYTAAGSFPAACQNYCSLSSGSFFRDLTIFSVHSGNSTDWLSVPI